MLKCSGAFKFIVFFLNGDIKIWSFLWYNGRYHSQMHFKWPRKQNGGKNSSVASAPWPRTVLWLQDHPSHSKSQHRCCLGHLIVWVFLLPKGKTNLPKKKKKMHYTSCITQRWMGTLAKVFHHEPVLWESHKGKKTGIFKFLYYPIQLWFQPKLMLALLSRIPSFHTGKMRSRTNRLSMLVFPCVSKRDISVWKWALKPAWLIQFWFTIV